MLGFFFHEGRFNRDLGCRHGEGVLAILLGQLRFIAILVSNSDALQNVSLVRIGREGHGRSSGCTAAICAHFAILGILNADGVGDHSAAAGGKV